MFLKKFNNVCSNTKFQRSFYLFFFILWTLFLWNRITYCWTCDSSTGLSYGLLYLPLALLLFLQGIINNRIIWLVCFIVFILISLYLINDTMDFYTTYKMKMGLHLDYLFTSEIFVLIPSIIVNTILYKIKPHYREVDY